MGIKVNGGLSRTGIIWKVNTKEGSGNWKCGKRQDFSDRKYLLLQKNFPDTEKYKLTDQLLRASRSITACIAEGYGRYHYQENIQFCRQTRGSLMKCLDHLTCALDEGYFDNAEFIKFEKQDDKILKRLNGYIAFLKRKKLDN